LHVVRLSIVALPVLLLGAAVTLSAQQQAPKLDLAVTCISQRSIEVGTNPSFWTQGGSMELGSDVWKGFGIAADVTGTHAASIGTSGIPVSLVTVTFGPRFRWHAEKRASVYGQALLGEADGFRSLYPTPAKADVSANGLALQVGGGLDYKLRQHFSIRLLDAAWLRTQLPNSTSNVQNNLRLGAGLVLRFGR
jgi:hypothetical protein